MLIAVSVALAWFWALPSGSTFRWIITSGCFIAGAFGVFEARKGWCIVRAMGFKTPI